MKMRRVINLAHPRDTGVPIGLIELTEEELAAMRRGEKLNLKRDVLVKLTEKKRLIG